MKAFGASAAQIEEQRQKILAKQRIDVLECNIEAVEIFLGCKMDREIGPSGQMVFSGISRLEIPKVAEMLGFEKPSRETFTKLRILENAAIETLNRR